MFVGIRSTACLTSLGDTTATLAGWASQHSAFQPHPFFDAEFYPDTHVAALPRRGLDPVASRFLPAVAAQALEVASAALTADDLNVPRGRIGLYMGYGGLRARWEEWAHTLVGQTEDGQDAWQRGLRHLHPYWMLRYLSNNLHAVFSQRFKLTGDGATFAGGNAGAQAIAAASRSLFLGYCDLALVVAYDTWIEPEVLLELGGSGIPLGEAVGVLVLCRTEDDPIAPRLWAEASGDGTTTWPAPQSWLPMLDRLRAFWPEPIDLWDRADPTDRFGERSVVASRFQPARETALIAQTGRCGAVDSVLQAISFSGQKFNRSLGLSASYPGLLALVAVECP